MSNWIQGFLAIMRSNEQVVDHSSPHTLAALERHKTQGILLAFRARVLALIVIAVLLLVLNPRLDTFYYIFFASLFVLNGWAQLRTAQSGAQPCRSAVVNFGLCSFDIGHFGTQPVSPDRLATGKCEYRFGGHTYFYIYLALGTLAFSWRTVRGIGSMAAIVWLVGVAVIWLQSSDHPSSVLLRGALADFPLMANIIDPSALRFDLRIQEVVLFSTVAFILSLMAKRFNDLLFENAAVERERTNLARYFFPQYGG